MIGQHLLCVTILFLISGCLSKAKAVICPDPGEITNGYRRPHGLYFKDSVIRYTCYESFTLIGSSSITCQANGRWTNDVPKCVAVTCQPPIIKNGQALLSEKRVFASGDHLRIGCQSGFYYPGYSGAVDIICVKDLHWTLANGHDLAGHCQAYCPWPEEIKHASHTVEHSGYGLAAEGATVTYICDPRFTLGGSRFPTRSVTYTCRNSKWTGRIDFEQMECVEAPKECQNPTDIANGNWNFVDLGKKQVGGQIQYECLEGFQLIGSDKLTCMSNQFWSERPPHCAEKGVTCPNPPIVPHSEMYCEPQSFECVGYESVTVNYYCLAGYQAVNSNGRITCLTNGSWSAQPHACVQVDSTSPSSNLSQVSSGPNTITVVIATGSSVLGTLLVVIVVVLIKRRKPAATIWQTNPSSPPAYTRQRTDSLDEHDRVALIAVAEGVRVVLPSYDEAVRTRSSRSSVTSPHRNRANLDYRPLPRIPNGFRGSGDLSIHSAPRDDASSNHPSIGDSVSVRRQSTLTIGTNRDALSENFGSIETMNVSDTSTAITLGTYDSSASNPSLAAGSHKATAGSLMSQPSDEDEDAPLLENNGSSRAHGERGAASQSTAPDEE